MVIDTYSGSVHILDEYAHHITEAFEAAQKAGNLASWISKDPSTGERCLEDSVRADLLADLQKAFPEAERSHLQESLDEMDALIREDQLLTEDSYADLSLNLRDRKTYVKALCLNVAHTCNLDCDYCFASQGKYHGERALMTIPVAEHAVDFVIEASGPHRNIDIDFFGGEPTLNWDLVKHTVAYARSKEEETGKNFRFTFTTNGLLLDEEMTEYLNREMHNVVLSMDGRKAVHDRLRHSVDGRGSYDRILPRFKHFVSQRGTQEYYMRGTYTKNNTDFSNDVLHMASLGFYRLSMEPVIGDPSEPYMLGPNDVETLNQEYDKLAQEMIRRNRLAQDRIAQGGSVDDLPPEDHPFVFYHFMMNLEGGPCIHKRISGCGSGSEYLAVTPTGELYPCHQFVGEEPYIVGNVWDGVQKPEIVGDFKECNCYSRKECQSCWAKLYCSGGCAANALHATGSLLGTVPFSCDLFRKRVECALAIKADEALYEPKQ